jgi:hypothetical protein
MQFQDTLVAVNDILTVEINTQDCKQTNVTTAESGYSNGSRVTCNISHLKLKLSASKVQELQVKCQILNLKDLTFIDT